MRAIGNLKCSANAFEAVLLACALALPLALGVGVGSAYADYPARSSCDISWYTDSETSFALSSAEQLAGLAYLVSERQKTFTGKTVTLSADIDLSGICSNGIDWRPIGSGYSTGTPFQGTFDGGDHAITGLLIDNSGYYNALFGSVSGATVKNLSVSGTVRGSDYVGGIVSLCNDSDLSNLTNYCTVDALSYNAGTAHEGRAAGVVCYVASAYPRADRTFEKLVNRGTVSSSSYYTAGTIGFIYSANGHPTSVIDCANYGDVTVVQARYGLDGANVDNKAVGGVVGATALGYGTYIMSGLVNEGAVSAANLVAAGGVVGHLGGVGSTLAYSVNAGAVENPGASGGVVGNLGSADIGVSNSLNLGVVSGGSPGGIVGDASNAGNRLENNYMLEGTAPSAYGPNASASDASAVRSAAAMKKKSFLAQLNADDPHFSIISGVREGLPVMAWAHGVPAGTGGLGDSKSGDDEGDANGGAKGDGEGEGAGGAGSAKGGDGSGKGGNGGAGDDRLSLEQPSNREDGAKQAEQAGGAEDPDSYLEPFRQPESGGESGGGPKAASTLVDATPEDTGLPDEEDLAFEQPQEETAVDVAEVEEQAVEPEPEPEEDAEPEPEEDTELEPEEDTEPEPEPEEQRELVELSAVVRHRVAESPKFGVPTETAAVSAAVAVLFMALGLLHENRMFTRSGGGWPGKPLPAQRKVRS